MAKPAKHINGKMKMISGNIKARSTVPEEIEHTGWRTKIWERRQELKKEK